MNDHYKSHKSSKPTIVYVRCGVYIQNDGDHSVFIYLVSVFWNVCFILHALSYATEINYKCGVPDGQLEVTIY